MEDIISPLRYLIKDIHYQWKILSQFEYKFREIT